MNTNPDKNSDKKNEGSSSQEYNKKMTMIIVIILVVIVMSIVAINRIKSLVSNKDDFNIHPGINVPTIQYENNKR